jgi:hypothetical protein
MDVRITRTFRIMEKEGTRKYCPGEVAQGDTAAWALENGYGVPVDGPEGKTEKSRNGAPKNKAAAPKANK